MNLNFKHKNKLLFSAIMSITVMACVFVLLLGIIPNLYRANKSAMADSASSSLEGYTPVADLSADLDGVYLVETADDLRTIAYYVNGDFTEASDLDKQSLYSTASYRLVNHLNLSSWSLWEPIGSFGKPFMGNFDGNGKTIYGLTIINQEEENLSSSTYGLFGYVKGDETFSPRINNLGLKDVIIQTEGAYVGALIGAAEGLSSKTEIGDDGVVVSASILVEECYSTGYVEGANYVGGMIGRFANGVFRNCYTASSTPDLNRYSVDSVIYNETYDVYSNNVSSGFVGGLVGDVGGDNTSVRLSYSSAVVAGGLNRGALLGKCFDNYSANKYQFGTLVYLKSLVIGTDNNPIGVSYEDKADKISVFRRCDFGYKLLKKNEWYYPDGFIWILHEVVNGFLPVLANTPQLVKLDFDAILEDGTSVSGSNVSAKISSLDVIVFELDNGTVLVEQGETPFVVAEIVSGSDEEKIYEINGDLDYVWNFTAYDKAFIADKYTVGFGKYAENTQNYQVKNQARAFTHGDGKIVAYFAEREFDVTLQTYSSDGSSAVLASQITMQVAGQDVVSSDNATLTVKAKYLDSIEVVVTPIDGYIISSDDWTDNTFTLSVSQLVNNSIVVSIPTAVTLPVELSKKSYNVEVESSQAGWEAIITGVSNGKVSFGDQISLEYALIENGQTGYDSDAVNYVFVNWEITTIQNGQEVKYYDATLQTATFDIENFDNGSTITVVALFEEITYNLILLNDVGGQTKAYDRVNGDYIEKNSFVYDEMFYITLIENVGYDAVGVDINHEIYYFEDGELSLVDENGIILIELDGRIFNQQVSIQGIFDKEVYDVNIVVTNLDGQQIGATVLDVNGDEYAVNNKFEFESSIELNVELQTGYELVKIQYGSEVVNSLNTTLNIVNDVDIEVVVKLKDFVINASFGYVDDTIYRVDNSNIMIYSSGNEADGVYNYGSNIQIEASLPDMFEIDHWTVNGTEVSSLSNVLALSDIDTNNDVVAFVKLHTINVSFGVTGDDEYGSWYQISTANETVDYSLSTTNKVLKYGDVLNLAVNEAYAEGGAREGMYDFAYWKVNGVPVSTNMYLNLIAKVENLDIVAVFTPANLKVTADVLVYDCKAQSYAASSVAGEVFGLDATEYTYLSELALTAEANKNYRFIGWYKLSNEEYVELTTELEYEFVLQNETHLIAVFEKTAKLSLVNSDASAGVLTGANVYSVGEIVNISAQANKGFKFVAWLNNGSIISRLSDISFEMTDGDMTLVAEFDPVYNISYSANNKDLGKVIGDTSGNYKENITLEAISEDNCTFIGWVIDNVIVSTSEKLNITLNGNVEVEALFKKNFDWNIIIVLVGCLLFAVIVIAGVSTYIKMKESEPVMVRALINGKDDKDVIFKKEKRNAKRDSIDPVPTRKTTKSNVHPIPVRKITVAPSNHKGEEVKKTPKAKEQKPTLKTDDKE